MRLLTHNTLRNNAKGVIEGFPLKIEAAKLEVRDSEPDLAFLEHLLPIINWPGLKSAATDIGLDASILPDTYTQAQTHAKGDAEFCKALYKMLFDVYVVEGSLVCPESGRKFKIVGGVADMMLTDEEVD